MNQYLKDSVDQIVNFFESSAAVTQTVALETAAAVQVWLKKFLLHEVTSFVYVYKFITAVLFDS